MEMELDNESLKITILIDGIRSLLKDMSSSSVSSGGSLTRKCLCGDEAVMKPSGTKSNPGRRFLGCRKYPDPNRCSFFEWVDEGCKRCNPVILEQKETIGNLYDQIKYMEEKVKLFEDKYDKKVEEYESKAKDFHNMTQVHEWKIKEMKRMERKKIKEARTMERNFWMKWLVALLVLVGGCICFNYGVRDEGIALPR